MMRWFLILSFFLVSLPAGAEIYKWVDADGVVHYSSRASQNAESEDVTSRVKSKGNFVSEPSPPPDASAKTTGDKNDAATDSKSVTVFTNLGCSTCKQVKAYLNARGIAYKEYDVSKDVEGKKRYAELGGSSYPFIVVGEQHMSGFNEKGLEKMLKTAGIL
ncbi:MAG: glutaredoxin family protein [Acidiferrobacterales bacterium]|nr:glutaredoxin family protein [Acidiferrobacterales bacterium]